MGAVPRYHTDAISSMECSYNSQLKGWAVYSGSWDQSVIMWMAPGEPRSNTDAVKELAPASPPEDEAQSSEEDKPHSEEAETHSEV